MKQSLCKNGLFSDCLFTDGHEAECSVVSVRCDTSGEMVLSGGETTLRWEDVERNLDPGTLALLVIIFEYWLLNL